MIDNIISNLIIIQQAFGAGSVASYKLYKSIKSKGLLGAKMVDILKSGIVSEKTINKINAVKDSDVNRIIKDCSDNNIKIVTVDSKIYPERLRNISAPPLVLYIKGTLPQIDLLPTICIVGPRIDKVSEFGKKAAYSLSLRLARAGFIVVSGAATGSDTYAHIGAIRGGGKTIAVLGCGICYDYLPENRSLRNKIAQNCCLISEYPPFAPTTRYSFPIRNRIMSALALGTIVIEAGQKSGALNTAKHSYEQGRDVFVIPGNPTDENYKGSNELLRDGATPLIDASDVFNQYIPSFAEFIDIKKAFEPIENKKNDKIISKNSDIGLSNEAKMVYNNLNKQKFTADDLIDIGISDDDIISALTELEMEHIIKSLPGGIYELI